MTNTTLPRISNCSSSASTSVASHDVLVQVLVEVVIFVSVVFVSAIRVWQIRNKRHDRPRHYNMSQLTKKYLPILKRINKLADNNKKKYLRKCNREFIDCLSECATNVLRGNVPLSSRQGAKLKRNKKDLRLLSAKKTSLRKKRHIVQKGGFLGALLTPVLSLLGGLISNAVR